VDVAAKSNHFLELLDVIQRRFRSANEAPVMTRLLVHISHWSRRCLQGLRIPLLGAALCLLLAAPNGAVAQDETKPTPRALSRIPHQDDSKTPAKELLTRKTRSTKHEARSIGFYSAGCLAGGATLPISGPAWQVMPLSRDRNWGHPTLVRFLENLALEVRKAQGCSTLYTESVKQQ
jgi:hypothetical protein